MGFEPTNHGFAIRSLRPLGYTAGRGHTWWPQGPSASIRTGAFPYASLVRIPGLLSLLVTAVAGAAEVGTRPPPLAEGSVLTRVQGTLVQGKGDEGWHFRLRDAFEGEADRELDLLPAAALEDMVRRFESLPPGGEARFELTGTVTLYRDRNGVVPWMVVPVAEFAARTSRPVLRPPGAAVPDVPVPEVAVDDAEWRPRPSDQRPAFGSRWVPVLPEVRRQLAERPLSQSGEVQSDEVERRLMERVGEAARSLDMSDEEVEAVQESERLVGPHGSIDPLRQRPWLDADRSVQDRLGMVTRDPVTGAWRFVFESSRGAVGEREATLLPGQVLDRLERSARGQHGPFEVVLSGSITRYKGRAYLLPSGFKPLRAGKALGR